MAKNCMAAVAKMLGVELGEEFIIENKDRKETVVLAMDGFHVIQPNNVVGIDNGKLLSKVLQGLYTVKKIPWEPQEGDMYYVLNTRALFIESFMWDNGTFDYAAKNMGIIYRTKAEAEAHLEDDYEKLTGKPLSEGVDHGRGKEKEAQ